MKTLSIRQMRTQLGQLDELLQQEGQIVITKRNKPIARLVATDPAAPRPDHADLRRKSGKVLTASADLIRQDREGR